MVCEFPAYIGPGEFYRCGKCLPCRVNRRRMWTARILLELTQHHESSFVTFTYSDENLIYGSQEHPTLCPPHMTLYWKTLRNMGHKFRYFYCGEYGEQTQRPHYHAIIFGLGPEYEAEFQYHWTYGFTMTKEVLPTAAAYVANYTVDKLRKEETHKERGVQGEFARMSRKPGIGAEAAEHLADQLFTKKGKAVKELEDDVFSTFRFEGKEYPLDNFIRNRMREHAGRPKKKGKSTRPEVRKARVQSKNEKRYQERNRGKKTKQIV